MSWPHVGPGCGVDGCVRCGIARAAQCGSKVGYQSKALAENAAVLHELAGRPGMSAYFCPWCERPTWHVGHATGSVRPLKRQRRRAWRRAGRRDPRSLPRPGHRPALPDAPSGPVSA